MRLALVLVILTVLFVSGCVSDAPEASSAEADPTESRTPRTSRGGSASVAADPAACPSLNATSSEPPVDIQEKGTALQGASKEWKWKVGPGYTTHSIDLGMEGPVIAVVGGEVSLSTDACSKVSRRSGPGGFQGSVGGTVNYVRHSDSDGGDEGNWTLRFRADSGTIGEWRVSIVVRYR